MAWIEVHQGLFRHRKTIALAEALKLPRLKAGAHLISLWLWAIDNALDGDLSLISSRAIATGAEWSGDPDRFLEALESCGWVDRENERRHIHDWFAYAGKLSANRLATRERVRRYRERQATVTRYTPVTKRLRNADVTHYRTVPNVTPPTPLKGEQQKKVKTARKKKPEPSVSEAFMVEMIRDYAAVWSEQRVREMVAQALAHKAARSYSDSWDLYVKGWLRRDAERSQNDRQPRASPSQNAHTPQVARDPDVARLKAGLPLSWSPSFRGENP